MTTIRAFIAIPLPVQLKKHLSSLQRLLRKSDINTSWINVQSMHLTLKFLGEIQETQIPVIQNAMIETASAIKPFELSISGVGGFPSIRSARIIWAGVRHNEILERLASDLDSVLLHTAAIKKNKKRYFPHLTLARSKRSVNLDRFIMTRFVKEWENSCFGDKKFFVPEMILFKSTLMPSGAKHEKIFSALF